MSPDLSAQYPREYVDLMSLEQRNPSELCSKYLGSDAFIKMGHVNRYANYRQKQRIQPDWQRFLYRNGYDMEKNPYSYCLGSWEMGFNAIGKYDQKCPSYNQGAFARAMEAMYALYSQVKKSRLADCYYSYMDYSTSPGYPWSRKYKTKGEAMKDPVFVEYVDQYVQRGGGDAIATNVVKGEPKKKEKILANNGRVITSMPMECIAFGNYLFADQNANIYKAAQDDLIFSTVGVTKYYRGHATLFNKMRAFNNGIEADFTAFDGSMDSDMIRMVANLRYSMMVPELQTADTLAMIHNYYVLMQYTPIVMEDGTLIRKTTGNPSGQSNTILDNCMVNEFRWLYAYELLVKPDDETLYASFMDNVRLSVCGDDSIVTVSDDVKHLYNPQAIKSIFEEHNWKMKFSSSEFVPTRELTYCSLRFGVFDGHVVPVPTNMEKLIASLYYGGGNCEPRETLSRAIGIRLDSFFHQEMCQMLDSFIGEMLTKYHWWLKQDPSYPDEQCLADLLTCYKSRAQIMHLYLGNPYGVYVHRIGAIKDEKDF